jgi:hypothetical protein
VSGALTGPSMGGFGTGPTSYRAEPPVNGSQSNGTPANNGPGRHLPAWSDLTGAGNGGGTGAGNNGAGNNGTDLFGGRKPGSHGAPDPLPNRRESQPRTVDGELTEADLRPNIPRQLPSSPETQPDLWRSELADPMLDSIESRRVEEAPPPVAPPPSVPPPPAWPPVAPFPVHPPVDESNAAPPVPDKFAAALDVTTEMPRLRTDREPEDWNAPNGVGAGREPDLLASRSAPPAESSSMIGAGNSAADPVRVAYADQTMELPIFRELESAWFRGRENDSTPTLPPDERPVTMPAPVPAPAAAPDPEPEPEMQVAAAPTESVPVATGTTTGSAAMGSSPSSAGRPEAPEPAWRSAADEGWMAASAAAAPEVAVVTDAGLPKRVPMAQLVPGGVDKTTTSANRRSPEQVRGLLSAYHRGVQRGRTRGDDDKTPESSTTTGNSSHGGKEQEA